MSADPLTPAEAVAIAAVLEAHPTREKHWMRWVAKLCAIANESTPVEPESEHPTDRLEARNEAVPKVRKHPEDLTASTSTDVSGRHEQL